MTTDKRLIEHYIPIKEISAEASREKSIRHGHISTLHLWWARRPLVASRAAVFAALVPAPAVATKPRDQWTEDDLREQQELNQLVIELCKWEVSASTLEKARQRIRDAYPDGPPKVLDMFAGGGSIPLEALRLGCEAYALDLNPVAHIIELATLVYPQKYGKKLAEDVKKWGDWVLERVRAEVGDLYPLIPDPEFTESKADQVKKNIRLKQDKMFPTDEAEQMEMDLPESDGDEEDEAILDGTTADVPFGYLQPVAYLWTRTVTCPNPSCRATVPLVRQTWLKKKKNDNVALEMKPHPTENRMAFYVRHAKDPGDFGFDPAGFSQRGNSLCYRCGTTVTSEYVKQEGKAGHMAAQMIAIVCVRRGATSKAYLSPDEDNLPLPNDVEIQQRIEKLIAETGIMPLDEEIGGTTQYAPTPVYGFTRFRDLFTSRQMLMLLTYTKYIRLASEAILKNGENLEFTKAITTNLALALDKATTRNTSSAIWDLSSSGGRLAHVFARQALPMVWDFAEANPFSLASGSLTLALDGVVNVVLVLAKSDMRPAYIFRSSATLNPIENEICDAIITDPPYYDNVPYSDLSDFFYVWLKRSIGSLYPEHLTLELTPKKNEAVSFAYRHSDDKVAARSFYENLMFQAFSESYRVLKHNGNLTIVYAHKTTAGWSTLVDALRAAKFTIVEAWPLDTELPTRIRGQNSAALASSFFLVARKRENGHTGDYLNDVVPEMQRIVSERVRFFLQMGVTGADLNIAAVGAGLAPFTRYTKVELPNGEELTAAAYLDEVQREVVQVILGETGKTDPATQYYIMARNYYGEAWVEFDEANTLARATGVELDSGPDALARGRDALVEKSKSKARLRDYADRGGHESLGMPSPERPKAPLIDVLHRLLWLAENDNSKLQEFTAGLIVGGQDRYLLRLTAQALAGKALAGEPTPGAVRDERTNEQRAIDSLLASWRRVIGEG